jgi:dipeptidyl aminopeptidase/acylaminoacyl peptidase
MKKTIACFSFCFFFTSAFCQISLEKLLSVPFPSGLTTSGNTIAWIQNEQGRRNVFIAAAPDFKPQKLTDFMEDDGLELSSISFSADHQRLVFVKGGSSNRDGETPNPAQITSGTQQTIYSIHLQTREITQIGTGNQPVFSPNDNKLIFRRSGDIYLTDITAKESPKALVKIRGSVSALGWSPDGTKISFVSERGTHSFIGVYEFATNAVRFMEPGIDEDMEPVWSPDSRQIAFVRKTTPFPLKLKYTAIPESSPWSILVADVATGKAKTIFTADAGMGSAFWNNDSEIRLYWADGNKIIFPWEKDGWLHLYAIPANGGKSVLLTPGEFEVDRVCLSSDRKNIYYSSNQQDLSRRHLWKVNVAGGVPVQLTKGNGIETVPVVLSDNKTIAFFRSEACKPLTVSYIQENFLIKDIIPPTIDYPASQLTEPENITITATDGMSIPCQLFLPKNINKGKHPAIVYIHGGSRRQMLSGFLPMGYYHNAYTFNQWLASRGFIVLSVNYRSGTGYGLKFREAINYGAGGCSEFQDILGAGLYLKSRPDVDEKRIALWGGSYGGYLTAMGLAKASDLFSCGVDIHGVHNWKNDLEVYMEGYDPLKFVEESEKAFQSSPMAHFNTWHSPVLLIHGDDDHDVLFSETIELERALRERKVETEHLILPDEGHGFLLYRSWISVFTTMTQYLEKKLK